MAHEEYLDMYLAAQNNPRAPYYMVSFDLIDSKNMDLDRRILLQRNLYVIAKYVYNKLLIKEVDLNKQIVIDDDRFIRPWDSKSKFWNGNYIDPLIDGDSLLLTVLRDTVTKEEIIEWVEECKTHLNMEEEFHIADGYYETNNYEEGATKYFRGYLIKTLSTMHKPEIQNKLKLVKKRMSKGDNNESINNM